MNDYKRVEFNILLHSPHVTGNFLDTAIDHTVPYRFAIQFTRKTDGWTVIPHTTIPQLHSMQCSKNTD